MSPEIFPSDPTNIGLPSDANIIATDYYEILRVGPQADQDTIERVYRMLADRFRPDTAGTGDPEAFLRLGQAYETLANPNTRKRYNISRQYDKGSVRFWLRGRDFFDGVRGGQNRRLAVLCLLYRTRIGNFESPGLTILDLERSTAWTREEVTSALWYLCEKKWATLGESTAYSITADGFDVVESKLKDRLEFRVLATLCYYGLPGDLPTDLPADSGELAGGGLPRDIEAALATGGDTVAADHYESLGIGSQADEEVIEQVYRTLAGRFHPDNPRTGDANTFLRITEAYDTLSNKAARARYDSLRRRTERTSRFRLRSREFFDGIRGERLRRLALLCLLYRRSAADPAGLTVLDMEQLTGCTREELGSALWYLREKKWAISGEYTEYTITAAGFDVVENAALPGVQCQGNVSGENQSPHKMAESDNMLPTSPGLQYQPPDPAVVQVEMPGLVSAVPVEGSAVTPQRPSVAALTRKRVVLSMGGKGGVGKTSVMTGLAEWFGENQIPVTMLDLDTENKAIGSLAHFFSGRVPKINIHTPAGLDAFVDNLAEDAPVILADMGAGAGHVTHDWFDKMYPDVSEAGVAFTAIGVVTSDPASVESVLNWVAALQDRANYVVVRNHLTEHADFSYWDENDQAQEFRRRFNPAVIRLDYRLADLENAVRNHGVTLGQVASRSSSAPELQKASLVMRAQSYRRRMFAEFDKVKELLLP